jgi:hypothetical protein
MSIVRRTLPVARALFMLLSLPVAATLAQQATPPELTAVEATKLAELMCRQLPNVEFVASEVIYATSNGSAPAPSREPVELDDAYDTLDRLGKYSLPCLTDRLLDPRWMPDPRGEPLLGQPLVGDVAYMVLMDKGVKDVLPAIGHQPTGMPGMLYYLWWPSVGDHRKRLQQAVRAWIAKHPDCCGGLPLMRKTAPSQLKFQMSPSALAKMRVQFSRLHPGMSPEEVLKITGKPEGIDSGDADPSHARVYLLGYTANDHNEDLAYIYFTERWTDDISRRDPLRDRYVIVLFSAQGKLTRMFSNISDVPAIFPSSKALWQRLMWETNTNN